MTYQVHPVAIIGCGPAGAAASIFLTKNRIQHIILDKDIFPRDKICGDGCSGKTAYVLRQANPEFLDEIFSQPEAFLPSYGVKFVSPNGKALDIPFSLEKDKSMRPPGFTSKRTVFDNYLFTKLASPYCTIINNATAVSLDKTEEGYAIDYKISGSAQVNTLRCNLLIGADGDKGITRKTFIQGNAVSKTSIVGIRAYYDGVTDMHEGNFIELHFLKEVLPGYFWIFPLPNGQANVGIGATAAIVRQKKINLRELMLKTVAEHPNIKHRFTNARLLDKISGWGLPTGAQPEELSGDNYMLTGDAASLVDAFTGEGIGNALFSGMIAAEAAAKAVQANNYSASFLKEHFANELFRRIGDELHLSQKMQGLVRYPWLLNLVINKAIKSPSLQKTMSSMLANVDVRALLRKPSFYWNILVNK